MRKIFTICSILVSLAGLSQHEPPGKQTADLRYIVSSCQPQVPVEFSKPVPHPPCADILKGRMSIQPDSIRSQNTGGVFSSERLVFRCYRTLPLVTDTLLIIDGKAGRSVRPSSEIPVNAKSVTVLSSMKATAIYGPDGASGAVIVTTAKKTPRELCIKDLQSNEPIAGATVVFISKGSGKRFQFISDETGMVPAGILKKNDSYNVVVSSAGYIPFDTLCENPGRPGKTTLYLERDIKTCEEVVLKPGCLITCRKDYSCWFYCSIPGITITLQSAQKPEPEISSTVLHTKVFPNPVGKGGQFTVAVNNPAGNITAIKITTVSGQLVYSRQLNTGKADANISINTSSSWPAGMYFLQLLYENGRVAASEKIIIQ